MWCHVYMGPPLYLVVHQKSAYISERMKKDFEAFGIRPDQASSKAPGSIETVERYHDILCLADGRIRDDTGREKESKIVYSLSY